MRCSLLALLVLAFTSLAHADDITIHVTGDSGVPLEKYVDDDWVPLCVSPCIAKVPMDIILKVPERKNLHGTFAFKLDQNIFNESELVVASGRPATRLAGLIIGGISVPFLVASAVTFFAGELIDAPPLICFFPPCASSSAGEPFVVAGIIGMVIHVIGVAAGFGVASNNKQTHVTQTPWSTTLRF